LQSKQPVPGSEASAGRRAFAQNVVVVQFEVTPKALAISAQLWSVRQPWDTREKKKFKR
jgi:hypothetical protein